MIANEVEIMRDELRARLAEQKIGMDRHLDLARQTPDELMTELREPASRRVKTLLVLSAIAEQEGIDAAGRRDRRRGRAAARAVPGRASASEYLSSRRGRSYLRMTLRNRTLVDSLIDRAVPAPPDQAEASAE